MNNNNNLYGIPNNGEKKSYYGNKKRGSVAAISKGLQYGSVMSYPNRGNWGDWKYRGNSSGHVIKDMIEFFNPTLFVDACEGSGTSREVCKDMNVDYVGLDLRYGNDFTKNQIITELPRPADICFSHPPYHDMIKYSGDVYGKSILDGDTSHCENIDEFIAKSQVMLMNQREDATC